MSRFQVSIIPAGARSSTYHARYDAGSYEDAVEQYINHDPSTSTGAKVAQSRGGIVVVTPLAKSYSRDGGEHPQVYGVRLFRVGPERIPPRPAAVIHEHVTA